MPSESRRFLDLGGEKRFGSCVSIFPTKFCRLLAGTENGQPSEGWADLVETDPLFGGIQNQKGGAPLLASRA